MSKILRSALVALGLTTICLAWLVEPLIKRDHVAIYHWSGTSATLFGAVAICVAVVWLGLTLLVLSAQRPGRWRDLVWMGILLFLPWIALRNLRFLWPRRTPDWATLPHGYLVLPLWLLLAVLWRPAFSERFARVIEFSATVLSFVAISGVVFLTKFTWFWWQARALNDPLPLHSEQQGAAGNRPHPRVIWIVLDELSYQQVYEHRYPGLQLPAFDALAAQSTVFTQTKPAATYTEMAFPALFTGKPVDDVRSSGRGLLSIHDAGTGEWERFEQHGTVFQDALDDGYTTTVAGWYNPYCRILPAVLDHCYWSNLYNVQNGMVSQATLGSNLWGAASELIGYGRAGRLLSRRLHLPRQQNLLAVEQLADYRHLVAAGDSILKDRAADFVLLHLPIPHPGGIYNRATGQLTTGPATYVDNLALADKYMAHVRSLLEESGQWDSSTVVVMGDHGWRTTFVWETLPGWTKEEENASLGGRYDARPAYLVKLAGQQTGARIEEPFRAVKTRALLDALMTQRIRSADDLEAWVKTTAQRP
jgi:hypothetical protein